MGSVPNVGLMAQEARRRDDFPELVRRVLRPALLTGHAQAGRVAALFAMHARTLRRRLSAFGTSFRELLEESRYELVRQLALMDLHQTHVPSGPVDGLAVAQHELVVLCAHRRTGHAQGQAEGARETDDSGQDRAKHRDPCDT